MSTAQGAGENGASAFFLDLHMTREESSKDSNWQETSITIKDRVLEYSYRYGGYPEDKRINKRYSLSKTQEGELIAYIEENKLNRNIEEIKPTEGLGVAVDLRMEIGFENLETSVRIVGRSNIWSTDSAKKTNLEYHDFYYDVHSLLAFLNSQFGFNIVL